MAKAKQRVVTVISANALDWAANVLRRRFDEVFGWREAVLRADDIENVHQMRVSIRRLRSALRVFSPLLKIAESKKNLKQLADALGDARDLDVAIESLENLRKKTKNKAARKVIEAKLEKRLDKRENFQTVLNEMLEISAVKTLRQRFYGEIEKVLKDNQNAEAVTVEEFGCEAISKTLDEFCELSKSLYTPFDRENLHKLRISAKRLRYTIELFTLCSGGRILPFAEQFAEMQTFLGELHDRDIWIEHLSRKLTEETGRKQRGDFWLLSKFIDERTKNYRAALLLWSKWKKKNFIPKLQKMVAENRACRQF